ncbi:MAG: hypothetical protein SWK90_03205 [Chloroflexota bacterium]|nr:hypothetical protein [Chloroflexota bacterium]
MELEHRVKALEQEMENLKSEIWRTLLSIQESLSEEPVGASGWRKRAWGLALLNILAAITLFTNVHFYTPADASIEISSALSPWLRALWVAVAFLWLILQMYPLALLLDQEDQRLRGRALRNAISLLTVNPGFTAVLALSVLIVALISVLFPALWFLATFVLFVFVCSKAVRHLLALYRQRTQAEEGGEKGPSDEEGPAVFGGV